MPGSVPYKGSLPFSGLNDMGTMYPGGSFVIVSGTIATATVITTLAPHGLVSGDTIFWTASTTSVPALTASPQQVVTVISPTTFSIPVNCSTGATAGAYDVAITSIPVTGVGVSATVNTGSSHGLRIGDTVTITGSGSTPSLDGAQIVTEVLTPTSFQVGAVTNITVAGSTTAAHYSKTIFYSNTWDTGVDPDFVGLAITSVAGTAPVTTLVDIQGSFDGKNWFNTPYATMAAPQTLAVAQLTIASATTSNYKLAGPGEANYVPYKYVRLKFTSSTNIIVSCSLNALQTI